ncbi:hypothetical protein H1R20_g866, partial [Candolleomyces eurysporus]
MSDNSLPATSLPVLNSDDLPIDPVLAIIDAACAASTGCTQTFSDPDGPEASNSEDRFLTGPVGAVETGQLSHAEFMARAQGLKRQCTLSPCSEEEFEAYIHSVNPAEQILRLFLVSLECQDLLTVVSAGTAYTVPKDVKEAIIKYAQAFMLSPSILYYKKKIGPTTVLASGFY